MPIVFLILLHVSASISPCKCNFLNQGVYDEVENVSRSQFPYGFLFGASTSAYQIEGAYLEDGRGLSNWDAFCNVQGSIANGENGFIADDDYHRYLEDIEILHSLGVDSYRFSISWSRVLPKGRFGDVNPSGIMFYNNIIDNLLLKGIQPFVTIHHFDYPQELENRHGGWLSPLMQEDFFYFAELCFKSFGDRVKYWITINEPNIFGEMAYMRGVYPPAHCSPPYGTCSAGNSDVEPLTVVHNMLLAHGKVVKLYRQKFQPEQGGSIGIAVHAFMYEPFTDNEDDKEAANRALAFNVAWNLDPVVFGEYPPEMRQHHGSELPKFTSQERVLMKDSIDFIGINHYATLYAKDCLHSTCVCNTTDTSCIPGGDRAIRGFITTVSERNGIPIGEPTGMDRFFVVPRGMEQIVDYVKNRYHNKPMFITENGYSSLVEQIQTDSIGKHDAKRIEYHKAYLAYLARAVRNGADVRGYFIWSSMDNFEWASGYSKKFGLHYVDRSTLDRIPRSSAMWYRDFVGDNRAKSI